MSFIVVGVNEPTEMIVNMIAGRPWVTDRPLRRDGGLPWPAAPRFVFGGGVTATCVLTGDGVHAAASLTSAQVDTILASRVSACELEQQSTGRVWLSGQVQWRSNGAGAGGVGLQPTDGESIVIAANTLQVTGADPVGGGGPHSHPISGVTGVQAALDGKQAAGSYAAASHDHTLDQTTDTATRVAMTPAERSKLAGVATGSTKNATDAQLRDRATHTGTQAISTVTGLQTALDGKQAAGSYAPALGPDDNYVTDAEKTALHSHNNKTALDQVSGTNTGDQTLASLGAAPASHGHPIAGVTGVTGLQTALDGKAAASGQAPVNTLTPAGTVNVPATHSMHTLTMTGNTTLTFSNPTAGHVFALRLSGAFTPTFPASVTWAGGTAPTYASGSVYTFASFDAGTTWTGAKL